MSVQVLSRGAKAPISPATTVVVRERNKFARVDWDFFRLPEENDAHFRSIKALLMKSVESIYLSFSSSKSSFYGNGLVGHMDGLTFEEASMAADQIAALFEQHRQSSATH